MKRLALAAFLFLALLIVGCSGDGQTADDVVPKSTLTPVPPTSSSHSVAMPTETPVVSTDPKTTITPVATLPPTTMHMATPTPSPVPTPMPTVIPTATPTPAPEAAFGDGQSIVGEDISPGLYIITRPIEDGQQCRWERLKALTGTRDGKESRLWLWVRKGDS